VPEDATVESNISIAVGKLNSLAENREQRSKASSIDKHDLSGVVTPAIPPAESAQINPDEEQEGIPSFSLARTEDGSMPQPNPRPKQSTPDSEHIMHGPARHVQNDIPRVFVDRKISSPQGTPALNRLREHLFSHTEGLARQESTLWN
jgi:hypothetical protein